MSRQPIYSRDVWKQIEQLLQADWRGCREVTIRLAVGEFVGVSIEGVAFTSNAPECPTSVSSDCVTTEPDIELTTQQRASGDASGGNS